MITNSTNRILSTCQVLVLKVFHPLSLLISSLQIRRKGWETAPSFHSSALPLLPAQSLSLPWCWPCCSHPSLSELLSSNMSSLMPKPQFTIPSLSPSLPWVTSSDPAGFSSDAAINDMSSPGGHSHQQLPNQPGKACAETKFANPEPAQTNRFDSQFVYKMSRGPGDMLSNTMGVWSAKSRLPAKNSLGHVILVHSTNNSWENEKDSKRPGEMSQLDIMSGSCLDPDLNKPTIKTFMRHTGTLNTDWPFNNTKESVLIFLGVIMVLWLCYGMNTCTYLCKNVNYVYIKIMINKMKRWKLFKKQIVFQAHTDEWGTCMNFQRILKLPIRLIIILSRNDCIKSLQSFPTPLQLQALARVEKCFG